MIIIVKWSFWGDLMEDEEEYKRICDKLGFIAHEYKSPKATTEDDTWVNPFSVLTSEEIDFVLHYWKKMKFIK